MDVFQIDEKGLLFIAPDIDDWVPLEKMDIHVIFDLDDDLDRGVPEIPDQPGLSCPVSLRVGA